MNKLLEIMIHVSIVASFTSVAVYLLIHIFKNKISEQIKYKLAIASMILFILPITLVLPQIKTEQVLHVDRVNETINAPVIQSEIKELPSNQLPINTEEVYHTEFNTFTPRNIYLSVSLALVFTTLARYFLIAYRLRKFEKSIDSSSYEIENSKTQIFFINSAMSPFAFGIVNKKIFIPNNLKNHLNFEYLLKHEIIHTKRSDMFIKVMAQLICNIHWFNPIVYYSKHQLINLMESSCDEIVASELSNIEKRGYAELLLDVATQSSSDGYSLTPSFSMKQKKVIKRMERFMNPKKLSNKVKYIVLVGALISTLCIGLITRGLIHANTPQEEANPEVLTQPESEQKEPKDDLVDDVVEEQVSEEPNQENPTPTEPVEEAPKVEIEKTPTKTETTNTPDTSSSIINNSETTNSEISFRFPTGKDSKIICEFECYNGHKAVDFTYNNTQVEDLPVYAIGSGKVIESKTGDGYGHGTYMVILHDNGYKSLYAHMTPESVLPINSRVEKGKRIGNIGMTGATTYPHVHLEIIDASGTRLNALDFIKN